MQSHCLVLWTAEKNECQQHAAMMEFRSGQYNADTYRTFVRRTKKVEMNSVKVIVETILVKHFS